jgi:hypothetical protein
MRALAPDDRERLGLRWSCVEFRRGAIRIERRWRAESGKHERAPAAQTLRIQDWRREVIRPPGSAGRAHPGLRIGTVQRRSTTMKSMNGFIAISLALALASGTLACGREKGTMEKAGEKLDNAVDDITHPGEGPVEEAGRKLGEKVDDVKKDIQN